METFRSSKRSGIALINSGSSMPNLEGAHLPSEPAKAGFRRTPIVALRLLAAAIRLMSFISFRLSAVRIHLPKQHSISFEVFPGAEK